MKTIIELSESTFRQANSLAADRGVTLQQFFTETLEEKVRRCASIGSEREKKAPWMAGFGELSDLSSENSHILAAIEEEFETLSPEDLT